MIIIINIILFITILLLLLLLLLLLEHPLEKSWLLKWITIKHSPFGLIFGLRPLFIGNLLRTWVYELTNLKPLDRIKRKFNLI